MKRILLTHGHLDHVGLAGKISKISCAEVFIHPLDRNKSLARALKEPGGEDEERRLFYVATTRAKDQLYFCHTAVDFMKGMRKKLLHPSRFIKELAPSYLQPSEFPFDQWIVD